MKKIAEKIKRLILLPKKEKLISGLESVVLGKEVSYIPEIQNPKYFEVWFYWAFDFKYIIIGNQNHVVDVMAKNDSTLIHELFEEFKNEFKDLEKAEEEFSKLIQNLEFDFFSNCWEELELKVKIKFRCFLIEHGIIRGIDVNNREKIYGEIIGDILDKEGIENPY